MSKKNIFCVPFLPQNPQLYGNVRTTGPHAVLLDRCSPPQGNACTSNRGRLLRLGAESAGEAGMANPHRSDKADSQGHAPHWVHRTVSHSSVRGSDHAGSDKVDDETAAAQRPSGSSNGRSCVDAPPMTLRQCYAGGSSSATSATPMRR